MTLIGLRVCGESAVTRVAGDGAAPPGAPLDRLGTP